jgi:hypothetical protein
VYRLENIGKTTLELIEVQSGSYLGEDDIVRLEDVYGRDWVDWLVCLIFLTLFKENCLFSIDCWGLMCC